MSESSVIDLAVNDAFVAISYPGDDGFDLHKSDVFNTSLSNSALKHYDFIFSPFQSGANPTVLFKYSKSFRNPKFYFTSGNLLNHHSENKQSYINSVSKLIKILDSDVLRKVIYSRTKWIETESIDVYQLYLDLVLKYKDACVFLVNIPEIGCWCGATPEILIKQEGNDYKTTALAGTQKLVGDVENIKWENKEIEEQAFIQTFIKERLNEEGIDYEASQTKTIKAGAVCHIKTDFTIRNPKSIIDLISSLHPGPAISGYPKENAIKMIAECENYDRKYYTGYFGSLDNNNLQLYINLRSMEVFKNCCLMYLGGGITKDSNALSEWEETEMKSLTLGSLLTGHRVRN